MGAAFFGMAQDKRVNPKSGQVVITPKDPWPAFVDFSQLIGRRDQSFFRSITDAAATSAASDFNVVL